MNLAFVDDIYIHEKDNRVLYLNPSAPDWITINSFYKPIFDKFNNNNKEKDIYNFVNEHYKEESHILIPQLTEFIKTSNLFIENFKNRVIHNNIDNNPKYIYLTLTDNCNLKCCYCYATERKKQKNIGLEKWIEYINGVLDINKECIFIFTGGEPLMLPYVFDIAEYIKEKKCQSILLTNGTFIDNLSTAKKVSSLFSHIKISLDSIDESKSSLLRGAGILGKVENAYNLLLEAKANVIILSTVCSLTKDDVDSFAKYFDNNVNFQPFYSMGRGRSHNILNVSGKEYYDSLTQSSIFKLLAGFHKNIHTYKNNPFKRCAFAKEEISIDSSGNIFPCHMLHYDDLNCGNLNDKSFKDIYYSSSILKKMREINVDSIEQCSKCTFRNICGGACRARVDIEKNGVNGVNEFCEFEKNTILDALLYSYG